MNHESTIPALCWGVLGCARIALNHVIPGLCQAQGQTLGGLASARPGAALAAVADLQARGLAVPGSLHCYESYQDLLADPAVQAVYIPLANQLHLPWVLQAADAGKHILCEKPLGLNGSQARQMVDHCRSRGVFLREAFMYRHHPQWLEARRILGSGELGEVGAIQSFFSYCNTDPADIRNRPETGGGGLLDIGCYPVSLSRYLLGREPRAVLGQSLQDPQSGVDILFSAILDFSPVQSSFVVSTRLDGWQRVRIAGSKGHLELLIPFNAPEQEASPWQLWRNGRLEYQAEAQAHQYARELEDFARDLAVWQAGEQKTDPRFGGLPGADGLANMAVLDALRVSAAEGRGISLPD